jgi:hydrogenase maturation factor
VLNLAAMGLTAEQMGRQQFKAGDTIVLSSTMWTHGQAYQTQWKGTFRLTD